MEEGEENGEVYTGKALVTGTDDTTNFNASLDLDPRPIHLLTGGLGGSANSLESSEADTSSSRMEVKAAVEVKTCDRHPRPLARAHERHWVRRAQQEFAQKAAQRWADMLKSGMDERDDRAGNRKMQDVQREDESD